MGYIDNETMLNVKKKNTWLDLQLQQGARQLHLQKPFNRWKVQDKSKKIQNLPEPTRRITNF